MPNQTPNDLALFVFHEIQRSNVLHKPSETVFRELFNTLFYTSLQTGKRNLSE
ncbi:hypothetical protein SAMN05428975_0958 [Mucilaginibacter sp. OK268]|nr:hypothetical protein SAMN05428975_0958 [Mucilaginibacter sp. OK268]